MLKIKNVGDEHACCVPLLRKMFMEFGILPLDPSKEMEFWSVESSEDSLLGEPVLSTDEAGNQLRAVFFVTRKRRSKKTELFRFTELFAALHTTEANTTIQEAIDYFLIEKPGYIAPIAVICLGKIVEDNQKYTGCFLYNVPVLNPIIETEIPLDPEIKHIKKIRNHM